MNNNINENAKAIDMALEKISKLMLSFLRGDVSILEKKKNNHYKSPT